MTIGERIRMLRRQNGMTQKELAEACGMKDTAIGRYERGGANPKLETVQKIAETLGVPLNILMDDVFQKAFSKGLEEGYKISLTDYSLIEIMVSHNIFSDKERENIFQKIEQYREILNNTNGIDKLLKYGKKTHEKLEEKLLKILLNKSNCDLSNAIIVLSCFFSLKDTEQQSILEILLEHCYPDVHLKYFANFPEKLRSEDSNTTE